MEHKVGFYEKYIKRLLDFTLSFLALIILSPVLLVTALLVRIKLGSPIIFHQERPGKFLRELRREAGAQEVGRCFHRLLRLLLRFLLGNGDSIRVEQQNAR